MGAFCSSSSPNTPSAKTSTENKTNDFSSPVVHGISHDVVPALVDTPNAHFHQQQPIVVPTVDMPMEDNPPARTVSKQKLATGANRSFSNEEDFKLALATCREDIHLIFAVDMTKSNDSTGERTFDDQCLHELGTEDGNPYERAIGMTSKILRTDFHGSIPLILFGTDSKKDIDEPRIIESSGGGLKVEINIDSESKNQGRHSRNKDELLLAYRESVKKMKLANPTTLQHVIQFAKDRVVMTGQFQLLVVLVDGSTDIDYTEDDLRAIFTASCYPMGIVVVGVGDGPFTFFEDVDDQTWKPTMPKAGEKLVPVNKKLRGIVEKLEGEGIVSMFDNMQFVNFHEVCKESGKPEKNFFMAVFGEVPHFHREIRNKLGYTSKEKWKPRGKM